MALTRTPASSSTLTESWRPSLRRCRESVLGSVWTFRICVIKKLGEMHLIGAESIQTGFSACRVVSPAA